MVPQVRLRLRCPAEKEASSVRSEVAPGRSLHRCSTIDIAGRIEVLHARYLLMHSHLIGTTSSPSVSLTPESNSSSMEERFTARRREKSFFSMPDKCIPDKAATNGDLGSACSMSPRVPLGRSLGI